ncbi:MAG TPA: hypothetical protein VFJ94_09260 [Intrasporangium sp.]|uniref:hypothetical protein n=1 Tax=Intrasporangium sp. TaxID=1925024 RepID=UPI002D772A58|nr:hypothetical protein [Intrasporangium sp.]HET7398695.1 hypothetical protein [Intrasporangium sp.]
MPADAAIRRNLTTAAALLGALPAFVGHPGVGPVRCALPFADGRHESPGETRTAYLLRALGFELEPQFRLTVGGRTFRADFRLVGARVLVEFDGAVKYATGPDDRAEGTPGRNALFEEKQREDALRREGWIIVRLVWADLQDPELVRRRVLAALALSR